MQKTIFRHALLVILQSTNAELIAGIVCAEVENIKSLKGCGKIYMKMDRRENEDGNRITSAQKQN